jgi:hypothetical protein
MSRSRSSFDLSGAIAAAESLKPIAAPEEQPAAMYRSVPLVSFGPTAAGAPSVAPPPPEPPPPTPPPPTLPPPTPIAVAMNIEASQSEANVEVRVPEAPAAEDAARRPPRLPDLSDVTSPMVRCEKIIEWIVEAVGASDVFIADAAGLPIAGAIAEAEARLAASGVVASAIAHLAASIPGNHSTLFEVHLGDGPFFQLIGFDVASAQYIVGLSRATPLGFRQAHAVRLACRHALGGHEQKRNGQEALAEGASEGGA